MAIVHIELEHLRKIKIYSTPNLAIFRQIAYMDEARQRFQMVPSHIWGFCVVTQEENGVLDECLAGYVIYRPRVLTLDIERRKEILWRPMSVEQGQTWLQSNPLPWRHIKAQRGNA